MRQLRIRHNENIRGFRDLKPKDTLQVLRLGVQTPFGTEHLLLGTFSGHMQKFEPKSKKLHKISG